MLELYILKISLLYPQYAKEQGDDIRLVWLMKKHNIPRATFYRAINTLLDSGFLIRTGRDMYRTNFRFDNE